MEETKKTNKGLEIREKKRVTKEKKRYEIKENQIGVERKVKVKYTKTELKKGRWVTTTFTGEGIQKENKVYFEDGKYIFINRKGVKITPIDD